MSFDTVDLLTGNVFQVTWDLGRRCNYDCSYCPVHRHDNFSPHATLDKLKKNTDFLYSYIDTYMQYRDFKFAGISFTGGEPTVNPHFIPFIQYLKSKYEAEYKHKWDVNFALTSNGAMGSKMAVKVMENLRHITVSYHAESDQTLKKQVRDRILQFHTDGPNYNFTLSVNVMFHAAYFDECKDLCNFLDEHSIKYVPRIIGEEPDSKSKFAHQYTQEQLDWMKIYWKKDTAKVNNTIVETPKEQAIPVLNETNEKKEIGSKIGRPCCGSRDMCLSNNGVNTKSRFVDFREFQGWQCSVNWFFLHLEQQTDSIFHHQTCQAQFGGTRGPIGKISEGYKVVEDLRAKLESKSMPTIICPKRTCGCGLCAPKSRIKSEYTRVMKNHITDMSIFKLT
jgi:sulfatase maturation enzyme AslB (radical SAM superfamily)